jgi:hypothetical protein
MSIKVNSEIVSKINDEVRKSSSTLLEYFTTLEEKLKTCGGYEIPLHSLKMYKGSMGVVRTTHSYPIGQKSTGWNQTPHISEIGWNGRVQMTWIGNDGTFPEYISINHGSGGYNGGREEGLYKLNTDSRLFIKDLPLIYEQYLQYIDESSTLIAMEEGSDDDRKLLGAILEESHWGEKINDIRKILTGWNNYPVKGLNYNQGNIRLAEFRETVYPYINHKAQREVWSENKNIPWMIKDEFYKYGSGDLNQI